MTALPEPTRLAATGAGVAGQNSRACRVLVRVFRAGDDVNKDDVCLFCNPLFVAHFVPNLQGWGAAPGPSE
jgi:hypothetical protein